MQIGTDTGFGYGFNIIDEGNRPVVSLVYETLDNAKAAAIKAHSVIENAVLMQGHPGPGR